MVLGPTTVELAPPRDNVSLSPPCGNVHIKQVSPTHREKGRKKITEAINYKPNK
jgi:hypothetical protein